MVATTVLAILRFGGPVQTTSPEDLLSLLLAIALLCVVGLTRRTHVSVAWLATIGATSLATADLARYARLARPFLDDNEWRWMGIAISLGSLLAVGSALAYAASRPRLPGRRLTIDGLAIVIVVGGLASWAIANPDDAILIDSPIGALGVVTRSFLVLTLAFTALGVLGDLLPPADSARRRVALTHRGATIRSKSAQAAELQAFADELAPQVGRVPDGPPGRRADADRSRHPRRCRAGSPPDPCRRGARRPGRPPRCIPARRAGRCRGHRSSRMPSAAGDWEHVAVEWLAERVQRGSAMVTLEVAEPVADDADAGEPPADIMPLIRVAVLALSNVAAHAPESKATVRVRSEPSVVELSIVEDDGPGISDEALATARANGRRGMADLAAEAWRAARQSR